MRPLQSTSPERAPVAAVTRGLAILAIVWQALTMFPDPVFWPWRQQHWLDASLVAAAWACWLLLAVLTWVWRRPTVWSARVQALDAVLMLVAGVHLLTWAPVRLDDGWLAAASLVNLGVGLVGIALPMRWSIPIVAITVVYLTGVLAIASLGSVPNSEALPYGLYATALGAAVISSRRGLLQAAARSERAQAEQERAAANADAAHAVQHRVVELTRLLHETVLNTLNAIVRGVADTADARARSAERSRQSLDVLRSLRDVALAGTQDPAMTRAVEAEVNDLRGMGVRVDFDVVEPDHVTIAVRNAFTAVAREALINVARHARASHVQVRLAADAQAWSLEIRDDGVGFDASQASGRLGIANVMRDSVASVGGVLVIESAPGQGTQVIVRVPIPSQAALRGPYSGNVMSLPVLISFLALSLASLVRGFPTYERPLLAVAAFVVALVSAALVVVTGYRRVLPWWAVVAAALLAPVIYHLQVAASGWSEVTTWSEWASEFIVAMLFVVGAGGPAWAWLVALASWLVTQGDPLGELLQPGTAVIIAGALYARSVQRSQQAYLEAQRSRREQRSAEQADEQSTRLVTRRFVELADSTATELFAGLADASLDVLDEDVRRRCAAEEHYIRSLMRVDPQRSALDAMIMRLIKSAHRAGVMLDLDVSDGAAIDEERLVEFEASAQLGLGMADQSEPARLSVRREGGRDVLRLVAQIKTGWHPVQAAAPCLVLWDVDSRSAMWEVEQ